MVGKRTIGRHRKGRRTTVMISNTKEPKAPVSKSGPMPGSKPDAKDDLKTLAMPEVEKKLGSTPEGLSQAEVQEAARSIRS